MDDSLVHLKRVLKKGKAPTQKVVLKSLLRGNDTAWKIAEDTGLSYNAASIALHELNKNKVIHRIERGKYNANVFLIFLALMDTLKKLEEKEAQK